MTDTRTDSVASATAAPRHPLHAIQLVNLRVMELKLVANLDVGKETKVENFELATGHGEYDTERHRIQVKVAATMGRENDGESAFALKVELFGDFVVDPKRFDVKHVPKWASTNAPLILYPYLREQVYGLTMRAGFSAVTLPLLEIPSFKLVQQADGGAKLVDSRETPPT